MPRETKYAKQGRSTRSGRSDPLWETIVLLQERVKFLERQIRRSEKSKAVLEEEIGTLRQEVELLASRPSSSIRMRELELENQNLRRQVVRLGQMLVQLRVTVPVPFDRTFSSHGFS
jgi:predicted RNase H-like nuclease (RuvC/YqgF family)